MACIVKKQYRKHFIPLESDPEVFTDLIHDLGVSAALKFQDVFSFDEPAFFPHPAIALILIYPTSKDYEAQNAKLDEGIEERATTKAEDDVIWFKQSIHNACGLYAILHAICNGEARAHIRTF
jgi:ubiquitin carboxyl-terminal hydrolase L3